MCDLGVDGSWPLIVSPPYMEKNTGWNITFQAVHSHHFKAQFGKCLETVLP